MIGTYPLGLSLRCMYRSALCPVLSARPANSAWRFECCAFSLLVHIDNSDSWPTSTTTYCHWQANNNLQLVNDSEDYCSQGDGWQKLCLTWHLSLTYPKGSPDQSKISLGSDLRPVKTSLAIYFKQQDAITFPWWMYQKAKEEICHKQQDLNLTVKALNQAILNAAQNLPLEGPGKTRPY